MKKQPSWAKVNEAFYGLVDAVKDAAIRGSRCEGTAERGGEPTEASMSFFPARIPPPAMRYAM